MTRDSEERRNGEDPQGAECVARPSGAEGNRPDSIAHKQLIGRLTVTHEDIDRADHFFGCWPHVTVPTYFPAALAEAFARHRIASAVSLATGNRPDSIAHKQLIERLTSAAERGPYDKLHDAVDEAAQAILSLITERDELREALEEARAFILDQYYCAEAEALEGHPIDKAARPTWDAIHNALHNTTNHGEASGTLTSRKGEEA
jgi:hypothetical protein